MKEKLRKARERIVNWKIYLDRARMYMGYINFIMIIFLFVDSLKKYRFANWLIPKSSIGIIVLVPFFLLLSVALGYLDTRFGIRSEEAKQNTLNNPIMKDIDERLRSIESKLR